MCGDLEWVCVWGGGIWTAPSSIVSDWSVTLAKLQLVEAQRAKRVDRAQALAAPSLARLPTPAFPMGWRGFPTFLMGTATRHEESALVGRHTRANADSATLHSGCLEQSCCRRVVSSGTAQESTSQSEKAASNTPLILDGTPKRCIPARTLLCHLTSLPHPLPAHGCALDLVLPSHV